VEDHGISGHITAEAIMEALSEPRPWPPKAALASAEVRRQELTDPLLTAIEQALEDPHEVYEDEAQLCLYAFYLLAKWREPRAFPLLLRWLAMPRDSDPVDEWILARAPRLLASVCGGDRPELRAFVENRAMDEFRRANALSALAILVAWGELPRETVITYLRELLTGKLEREHSFIWDEVACLIADLDAEELVPFIRQTFADGLVDETVVALDEIENRPLRDGLTEFEHFQKANPPITDVAEELTPPSSEQSPWDSSHDQPPTSFDDAPAVPFVAEPKIGRNDQGPCGSGKKYKKCCGKNA
jgi:hypothetical protein